MKCDSCGCQFSAREAENVTYNEAISTPGKRPYTRIATMTICPGCAAHRAAKVQLVYWTVGLALAFAFITLVLKCYGLLP